MLLKKVLECQLPGWAPQFGYFMEIDHNLMGVFPAIHVKTKAVVVCLQRDDLEKIWKKLPRKQVKVCKMVFLVNEEKRSAILINGPREEMADSKEFFLVRSDDRRAYCQQKDFFRWAGGLISFTADRSVSFPAEQPS